MEKTRLAAEKTDIALLLVAGNGDAALDEEEMHWYRFLKEHGTPVLFVVGKTDKTRNAALRPWGSTSLPRLHLQILHARQLSTFLFQYGQLLLHTQERNIPPHKFGSSFHCWFEF